MSADDEERRVYKKSKKQRCDRLKEERDRQIETRRMRRWREEEQQRRVLFCRPKRMLFFYEGFDQRVSGVVFPRCCISANLKVTFDMHKTRMAITRFRVLQLASIQHSSHRISISAFSPKLPEPRTPHGT